MTNHFGLAAAKAAQHGSQRRRLFLAIVFTFTVRRRVAMADENRVRPLWSKLVALVSVILWSGVGLGGRWIGFS